MAFNAREKMTLQQIRKEKAERESRWLELVNELVGEGAKFTVVNFFDLAIKRDMVGDYNKVPFLHMARQFLRRLEADGFLVSATEPPDLTSHRWRLRFWAREEELRPCPFCGGPARLKVFEAGEVDDQKGYMPECADECAAADVVYESEGGAQVAVERWNTRAK